MDATNLSQALRDTLFPQTRCLVCGRRTELKLGLCRDCDRELTPLAHPFFAAPEHVLSALCLYPYEGAARTLIHVFKFAGQFDLPVRRVGPLLAQEVRKAGLPVESVVPVPTNLIRLYRRGYHQTKLLARAVARELSLPLRPYALRRKLRFAHQTGLGREQRLANVRTQYGRGLSLKGVVGKNVLLVDDVSTTGATASACAGALLAMGAKSVYFCCIAKVFDSD